MRYIDVHCHLDGGHYGNLDALFERLKAVGVQKIIAVGFDLQSSAFCRDIANLNDICYFTAGFHPTELAKYREGDLDKIAKLAEDKKCVAIGEIGLDYHYPDTQKALQRRIFGEQLKLACNLGLPVQIHSRDCAEDTLDVLKENADYLKNGAIMHCFSYSTEIAATLEKMGFYFSFGGTSTFSGSKRARKCIAAISQERLLTETDSPYMPPKSRAGEFPNTPESIPEICANIADIKGVTAETAAENVWRNAHELFKKL